MEGSTDSYGTDQANLINFSFDFEEAERVSENNFRSFEHFYLQNKSVFTTEIINNTLQTGKAIAEACRGKNKKEKKLLDKIIHLLKS